MPSTTNDNEYAAQCEIIAVTSFLKTKLCICCKFCMNDNESEMHPENCQLPERYVFDFVLE